MPIYEYLCEACGTQLDLLQKMNESAPPACKSCGAKDTLKKRISMSAFHLKGGGWYSELYASKAKGDNAPADSNSPSQGAASENKNPTPPPLPNSTATSETAPSPCAGCPAASSSACANAQKP
jgi:putative FmdB family regulatory protein